ncbi:hypothetical protein C8Q75DRAFT_29356 [Abortiporus biennis]|nr:hypothetical protein C8Q75DRAFT_29356 [Abortiporus biennis]
MSFDNIETTWSGLQQIKYLVIFGDSYSALASGHPYFPNLHPTVEMPLGVDFPGLTYNEPSLPNWVGYLITKYVSDHQILVFDYAVGGSTVSGVKTRIERFFVPKLGNHPTHAPWEGIDTLFITWVGINDLMFMTKEESVDEALQKLFSAQETLYGTGARNFLFIDVPPTYRAPALPKKREGEKAAIFMHWNHRLREHVANFKSAHPDAIALIFSSFELFTHILDNPREYGFPPEDVRESNGSIWFDYLHPTSKVHDEIARALFHFLQSQPISDSHSTDNDFTRGE